MNRANEIFNMKDCSLNIAPIVKSDRLDLSKCSKSDFEQKNIKNILYTSFFAPNLRLHLLLEFWKDIRVIQVLTIGKLPKRGCIDIRKSMSGYIFVLIDKVVPWRSTKQT
ncbi:hypothetical protein CR513_27435, partial [Mucuna pruriens]